MKGVRRWCGAALALAILLGVTGCAGSLETPREHYYRLEAGAAVAPQSAPLFSGTLAVARPRTDGLLNERALVYSKADRPLELRRYHYHQWVDAPALLLQDYLVQQLRARAVAPRVVAFTPGTDPEYRVEGRLNRLEHVHTAGGSKVEVSLNLAVSRTGRGAPLLQREYRRTAEVASGDMYGAVASFAQTFDSIVTQFVADMAATPRAEP